MRTTPFRLTMTAPCFWPVICLILCFIVSITRPAAAEHFTLRYAMFTGGFQAMTIDMDFTFHDAKAVPSYRAELHAKPYGLLGHFLPWAGEYSVTGITKAQNLYPTTHKKISRWRDDMDQYIMTYDDTKLTRVEKLESEDGKTVKELLVPDPEFTDHTADIMTAAIRTMQHLQHNASSCQNASDVFDGKRRFTLAFHDRGTEALQKSRYNIYNGDSLICDVEMIPLKGYAKKTKGYYKIQEASRAKGHLPRIWFGRLDGNTPNRFIPVKMLVKSDFGAIFVHLQQITHHTP